MSLGGVVGTIGGTILGGPLGGAIGGALGEGLTSERKRDQAVSDMERNFAFQREMAQMGIQWRVADAKKAGVHPVYAVGASVPSGAPVTVGSSVDDTGQDFSRVVGAMDPHQRAKNALELEVLRSTVGENDARAEYYRSEASRRNQPGQAAPPPAWIPSSLEGSSPYRAIPEPVAYQLEPGSSDQLPAAFDALKVKIPDQVSARSDTPWTTPGVQPGFDRHRITRYMEMVLPRNEEGWSEGLESVPYWMYPMVYQANVDTYGPHFARLAIQELGARHPFAVWLSRRNIRGTYPDYRGVQQWIRR